MYIKDLHKTQIKITPRKIKCILSAKILNVDLGFTSL